jgi:hypothetical protein
MTTPPPRTPEPSLRALAARVAALEARMSDIEGPYADTMYRTHRKIMGVQITLRRLAEQAGVPVATDEEIDAVLDESPDVPQRCA